MNAVAKQIIYMVRRRAPSRAKPYSPVAEFHGAAQDSRKRIGNKLQLQEKGKNVQPLYGVVYLLLPYPRLALLACSENTQIRAMV
jgi:hypothetical protein